MLDADRARADQLQGSTVCRSGRPTPPDGALLSSCATMRWAALDLFRQLREPRSAWRSRSCRIRLRPPSAAASLPRLSRVRCGPSRRCAPSAPDDENNRPRRARRCGFWCAGPQKERASCNPYANILWHYIASPKTSIQQYQCLGSREPLNPVRILCHNVKLRDRTYVGSQDAPEFRAWLEEQKPDENDYDGSEDEYNFGARKYVGKLTTPEFEAWLERQRAAKPNTAPQAPRRQRSRQRRRRGFAGR